MAFAKAKTALAQIEEKLRRQFNLAGEVGASLQPVITPVVITGDLREAGNSANQGRAFEYCFVGSNAAQQHFSVRNEAEIFVDRIFMSVNAAGQSACWLTVPGIAPAVAVTTLAGTWTDRKVISGDQVPLTQSAAFAALAGTTDTDQNRVCSGNLAGAGILQFDVNIMLAAQSHLNFRLAGGGLTAVIGFRGRIWP